MTSPLLRVRGVTKRYGSVLALSDVDLDVGAGEIVALVGENGSGKSTLSRVVSGAVRPDAGELSLAGVAHAFAHPRAALDAGVCVVSQEPTAVPGMSVAENVLLCQLQRPVRTVRRRQLRRLAEPLLHRVGLDIDPGLPLSAVPAGDRELVEVAKALAAQPRVLLLDEVTTRMSDPERLFTVVEELAADGVGVVFITHRLREIRRLAGRAVVLRDGRLVGGLARHELTDERISTAMVGRALGDFYTKATVALGDPLLLVRGLVTERSPHPLSLQVRAGEVVGLAGLVGAGRSELLETLAGVRRARAGDVRVGGAALADGSPRAARAAGVALVPEDRYRQGLLGLDTIRANLALGSHRMLGRTHRRREQDDAGRSVARYRIKCGSPADPVASLSGGNAQKVVLGRSLAGQPRVLLLDEPTRGVDVGARAEIYEVLAEQVRGGTAVLLASSDLLELIALCDRVLVLHEGDLVGEVGRAQATEEELVLLCAGGRRSA